MVSRGRRGKGLASAGLEASDGGRADSTFSLRTDKWIAGIVVNFFQKEGRLLSANVFFDDFFELVKGSETIVVSATGDRLHEGFLNRGEDWRKTEFSASNGFRPEYAAFLPDFHFAV